MLTLFILGFLLSLTDGAPSKRQFVMCNDFCTSTSCPRGYSCVSNGCGKVCEPTATLLGKKDLGDGACVDLCSPTGGKGSTSCPTGYECRSNGCGHTCQPSPDILYKILNKRCQFVFCDVYCPYGLEPAVGGCQTCTCRKEINLSANILQSLG